MLTRLVLKRGVSSILWGYILCNQETAEGAVGMGMRAGGSHVAIEEFGLLRVPRVLDKALHV